MGSEGNHPHSGEHPVDFSEYDNGVPRGVRKTSSSTLTIHIGCEKIIESHMHHSSMVYQANDRRLLDEVISWELQFLSDHVTVLLQERKHYQLQRIVSWCKHEAKIDNVKWLRLTKVCNQISLKLAWGHSETYGGRMSGIKTKIYCEILYSSKAQGMVMFDFGTHPEVLVEYESPLPQTQEHRYYYGMLRESLVKNFSGTLDTSFVIITQLL